MCAFARRPQSTLPARTSNRHDALRRAALTEDFSPSLQPVETRKTPPGGLITLTAATTALFLLIAYVVQVRHFAFPVLAAWLRMAVSWTGRPRQRQLVCVPGPWRRSNHSSEPVSCWGTSYFVSPYLCQVVTTFVVNATIVPAACSNAACQQAYLLASKVEPWLADHS